MNSMPKTIGQNASMFLMNSQRQYWFVELNIIERGLSQALDKNDRPVLVLIIQLSPNAIMPAAKDVFEARITFKVVANGIGNIDDAAPI